MSNLLSIHNSKNQVGIGTDIISVNSNNLTIKENTQKYIVCDTNNNSLEIYKTIELEDETTLSNVKTHSISSAKLLYISNNNEISSLALSSGQYLKVSNTGGLVLIDKTAPIISGLAIASNNSTTTLAKANDEVTLTITTNETISTPSVTFTSGSASINDSSITYAGSGTSWTAKYTVHSNDTAGSVAVSVTVTDLSGNQTTSTSITSGSVVVPFTLSSWLDTSKQYKIFVVGSSGMTQKTEGGKKMTSDSESYWSSNSKINAGLLDSTTRSTHLNSNNISSTYKSGAGYGIHWVGEGPYWVAVTDSGYPYGLADDHHISDEGFTAGQYDQGHIESHSSSTPQTYFYSTQTAQETTLQDNSTIEHNSVFNLAKGSQSDAYRFECKSNTRNSSKNVFNTASGYGGSMQTSPLTASPPNISHPYGDYNKIELSAQWKGGSPTGPSTLTVNTGGSDINYECVCVTIKGDYNNSTYGEDLSDDNDMKNLFWHETVSWASSRRILYFGVDGAGDTSYGGGNYWTWLNRYYGDNENATTHGNSTTLATIEWWICKIP